MLKYDNFCIDKELFCHGKFIFWEKHLHLIYQSSSIYALVFFCYLFVAVVAGPESDLVVSFGLVTVKRLN